MKRLESDFGHIRKDIRLALRCRLENKCGHYGNALSISDQINDKTTIFWKKLRRETFQGLLQNAALEDNIRAKYEEELDSIEEELGEALIDQFNVIETDLHYSF